MAQGRRSQLLLVVLVSCCLFAVKGATKKTPKNPAISRKAAALNSNSNSSNNNSNINNNTLIVQLTEAEVWNGQEWIAKPERWTQEGRPSLPPDHASLPASLPFFDQWIGDWKIVTGETRDNYGWEYLHDPTSPMRQRTWLRSYIIMKPSSKRRKAASKAHPFVTSSRRRVRAIKDNFNFKGYGWTFYKSLVFPKSFGAAFRLPLTFNFDAFDRRPGLPSLSSSFSVYYPPCVACFLSASLRIEFVKWIVASTAYTLVYILGWLLWTGGVQTLWVLVTALCFPLLRTWKAPPTLSATLPSAKTPQQVFGQGPDYSRDIEERVGASLSWRISQSRGYEFRVSYWHWYAPRLASIYNALLGDKKTSFPTTTTSPVTSTIRRMPAWFARRSAALALSTSAPIAEAPGMTCSAAMSLSGFYFKRADVSTTATTTVTPTLPDNGKQLDTSSLKAVLSTDDSADTTSTVASSLLTLDKDVRKLPAG
jgi:hypothetical protein